MSHMWFQSASDSSLQNNVIHKFTLNIYTTLLCALLGLIGLWNSSKCISEVHYLTLLVPLSMNALLNKQACLHRPPYGSKMAKSCLAHASLKENWDRKQTLELWSNQRTNSKQEYSFSEIRYGEGQMQFPRRRKTVWQTEVYFFKKTHDISKEIKAF